MAVKIGVIAEDQSDVDVLRALIRKTALKDFQVRQFLGKGHGKLISKCRPWAQVLKEKGCTLLLLVHDLDEKDIAVLRKSLQDALTPSPISKFVIVIPVKELESWLLADHQAIKVALNLKRHLPSVANPEGVMRPKERLRDLIYQYSDKKIEYVNTVHNLRIATSISIETLRERCESFAGLFDFVGRCLGVRLALQRRR